MVKSEPSRGLLCRVRERRTACRLSQSELATRIGVSRQALAAIEAGRQVPATSLALLLAETLSCRVEDLFTRRNATVLFARTAVANPPARVVVGRVDGAWVAHATVDDARPGDAIVTGVQADGKIAVEPLTDVDRLANNVLVAGCAPLLGLLSGRLTQRYADARAAWIPANSQRALDLLDAGLVHAAGVHLVDTRRPGGHAALARARFGRRAMVIVNLTQWRQGLVVAPGNPLGIRSAEDVLRDDVRFARREEGAGADAVVRTRLAGVDPVRWAPGPTAADHEEVARLVRWGVADFGVAIEAAALAEGLDFVPLAEERFDLLVPRERVDVPVVARLLDAIRHSTFRTEVARLPGYDVSAAGEAATVAAEGA